MLDEGGESRTPQVNGTRPLTPFEQHLLEKRQSIRDNKTGSGHPMATGNNQSKSTAIPSVKASFKTPSVNSKKSAKTSRPPSASSSADLAASVAALAKSVTPVQPSMNITSYSADHLKSIAAAAKKIAVDAESLASARSNDKVKAPVNTEIVKPGTKSIAPTVQSFSQPGSEASSTISKPKESSRPVFRPAMTPPSVLMKQQEEARSKAMVETIMKPLIPPVPPSRGGRSELSTPKIELATPMVASTDAAQPTEDPTDKNFEPVDDKALFEEARHKVQIRQEEIRREMEARQKSMQAATVKASSSGQSSVGLYNATVASLKDKIYQKGSFNILQYFQTLDSSGTGKLDRSKFTAALDLFNFKLGITEEVVEMLISEATKGKEDEEIDYRDFCELLRSGKINYRSDETQGRRRLGPDPEQPFGDTASEMPFGLMHDAEKNLSNFDESMMSLFKELGETFKNFDRDGKGTLSFEQFKSSLEEMNELRGLNLSEEEIVLIFKEADINRTGLVSYNDFLKVDGNRKRFLPEFLKPKSMRRSQSGHPWSWQ